MTVSLVDVMNDVKVSINSKKSKCSCKTRVLGNYRLHICLVFQRSSFHDKFFLLLGLHPRRSGARLSAQCPVPTAMTPSYISGLMIRPVALILRLSFTCLEALRSIRHAFVLSSF